MGSAVVDSAASLGLNADPGPDGQYRTFQVPGPISGHSGPVTVWFPSDYGSAAQDHHRFPVIEGFHGVPGSPSQFNSSAIHAGSTLSQEVAAGHLRDTIMVLPNYTPHQVDTECVNGTNTQPRMEDWVTKDVPAWVDTHLRVDRDRGSWATMGFSAGGWCAGMAAMLHPETYAAAIILLGYFQPTFEPAYIPFTASSPEGQHYDMARLARQQPPRVALWLLTSKADPVSYGTTKALLSDAKPPLSITATVLTNGGHRTSVLLPFIPKSFDWLGSNIPGFAPIR
jgi:predicted peptidase